MDWFTVQHLVYGKDLRYPITREEQDSQIEFTNENGLALSLFARVFFCKWQCFTAELSQSIGIIPANTQRSNNVVKTSMQRRDVAATL